METQIQKYVNQLADEFNVRSEQGAEEMQKIVDELIEDSLDVRYVVGAKGEYVACKFLIAFGGPNVWFDTESAAIEGCWSSDEAEAWLQPDLIEYVDDYMSEVWKGTR